MEKKLRGEILIMLHNKTSKSQIVVGIDASRARSGGAKAHLIGILTGLDPKDINVKKIHVWSYAALLDRLPNESWLIKHYSPERGSVFKQLFWQFFSLPRLLSKFSCDIVLNLDAGTVNPFQPSVTMSRDMLSYEPGEIDRYGYGRSWLRLLSLKYLQAWSLRRATSAVFLTKYASDIIQKYTGPLNNFCYIPHGVGSKFLNTKPKLDWPTINTTPIECIYVSNLAPYKHQWIVIQALQKLRSEGYNLSLKLVGDNDNKYKDRVESVLNGTEGAWVEMLGHTDPSVLPTLLSESHLFIFASSCENMPNSLVEAMAVGLPIACSNRGPMPEILSDGGVYFDPENYHSIASAVERIVCDQYLRRELSVKAKSLAKRYSWERCRDETFVNLITTFEEKW